MIQSNDILQATNGGLDIILSYYPQARESVTELRKPFSLRGEKTPSAFIRQFGDQWKVTDFGDDSHARSAFDICMREENMKFREAVCLLADRYGVSSTMNAAINKPDIRQRPATTEEIDGTFAIEFKKEWTKSELELFGTKVEQKHVDTLCYRSVAWYSKTKTNKAGVLETTTILSNDNYPIFARECSYKTKEGKDESFMKVYQPLNLDKAFRFFYTGKKPKDFVNGLAELLQAFKTLNDTERKIFEQNPLNEGKAYKEKKLDAAVICSGERDAMNCLSYGFQPIWLNSESATLEPKDYREITKCVEVVYNIPDIDETGKRKGIELGLKYLDIRTVKLPAWLSTYKDMRGKPRKDLRDYLDIRDERKDFEDLIDRAMPFKFWEWVQSPKGANLEINTAYMLNFLSDSGFGKLQDKTTKKETLVQVVGSVVKDVTSKDIRAFLVDFVRKNVSDIKIVNLVLNSTRTKTVTMDDLNKLDISFKNYETDAQFLFLANRTLEIKSTGLIEHRPGECSRYVWDDQISKHSFKRLDSEFVITREGDAFDIELKNVKSHYFRYLINSSRLFWREEMENRETGNPDEDEAYRLENKFTINGKRLHGEEIDEQEQNLISKIFSIGYFMHRYKSMAKTWALWVMEDKVSDDGVSSGGSGKSFMFKFLKEFKTVITLGGRNKKLTENQHIFENVTENTDFILVDDADQYVDFDFFYDKITGGMDVNEKHVKSKPLEYEESPKLGFTSNYPPRKGDSSTARRLLYVVFSDWYHERTEDNEYRETRRIIDDFGYELYGKEYKEEYWNEDINFLVDCMLFYLSLSGENIKLQPPMKKVHERMNISTMGNQFRDWAEVYFSPDSVNVDKELIRSKVMTAFQTDTNLKSWSTKQFSKAMKAFAQNSTWIYEINPVPLHNAGKRIVRNVDGTTQEILYVRTIDPETGNKKDITFNPF